MARAIQTNSEMVDAYCGASRRSIGRMIWRTVEIALNMETNVRRCGDTESDAMASLSVIHG